MFTQIRMAKDALYFAHVCWHTHFFTFAENIHSADCTIPELNLHWQPTRQPVVMSNWVQNKTAPAAAERVDKTLLFSTVMQWNSYDPVEWQSVTYGMKSATFPDYFDLPAQVANHSGDQSGNVKLGVAAGGEAVPEAVVKKTRMGGTTIATRHQNTHTLSRLYLRISGRIFGSKTRVRKSPVWVV